MRIVITSAETVCATSRCRAGIKAERLAAQVDFCLPIPIVATALLLAPAPR